MFTRILDVIVQGLTLWNKKESRKYLDKALDLRKRYREEFNRPDFSQLALDRMEDELSDLERTYMTLAPKEDA